MSSIAGFFQPDTIYSKDNEFCIETIHNMSQTLYHRGPDEQSFYYFPHGAFNQNFLQAGYIPGTFFHQIQPTTITYQENTYTLLFDGFISNSEAIAIDLENEQIKTNQFSLEKLLLMAFIQFGADFVQKLRGAFAIAIYDEGRKHLYLFRDALGLRPLFYSHIGQATIFASEIKALFCHPLVKPALDRDGLTKLLALGPARIPGDAIFSGIAEVKPGHYLIADKEGIKEQAFHHFQIRTHTDNYDDTKARVFELLNSSLDSLKGSVTPSCCFLSGGLDSSIVTAKLAQISPNTLATYSLEFEDSKQHFKANSFQPSLDAPYVQEMVKALSTEHSIYICNNNAQFEALKTSVKAHDLPTMADVDSSYMYFCSKVAPQHKIVFTGECADELFCGYPWYQDNTTDIGTFPWSNSMSTRRLLLNDDITNRLQLDSCAQDAYLNTCKEIGLDGAHTPPELLHHKTFYLTLRYFMQTLINRGDRAASINSMDARVPFAHQELAEYLFNVPLDMQMKNGERKHLLREFSIRLLPETVRMRKKSPYPKTYDPAYETLVNNAFLQELEKADSPLHLFIDKNKAQNYCRQTKDLGQPWYGQLMAGPQLVAYYLQILYWLEEYNIEIKF